MLAAASMTRKGTSHQLQMLRSILQPETLATNKPTVECSDGLQQLTKGILYSSGGEFGSNLVPEASSQDSNCGKLYKIRQVDGLLPPGTQRPAGCILFSACAAAWCARCKTRNDGSSTENAQVVGSWSVHKAYGPIRQKAMLHSGLRPEAREIGLKLFKVCRLPQGQGSYAELRAAIHMICCQAGAMAQSKDSA